MDDADLISIPDIPLLFGRYLVLQGLISEADLSHALDFQNDMCGSLACAALESEVLTLLEYRQCREYQRTHCVIFEQAVTTLGYIDEPQLLNLRLRLQRNRVPLGEVLVKQGKLRPHQLTELLADFAKNGVL